MNRIQRKYFKKLPQKSKSVTRPGRWGNPYKVVEENGLFFIKLDQFKAPIDGYKNKSDANKLAVIFYRIYLTKQLESNNLDLSDFDGIENIACFCKEHETCHGDVIIEKYNEYSNK